MAGDETVAAGAVGQVKLFCQCGDGGFGIAMGLQQGCKIAAPAEQAGQQLGEARVVEPCREIADQYRKSGVAAAVIVNLRLRFRQQGGSGGLVGDLEMRSEEHKSELQSLMRISYAVFCLKKK